jgi:rhodanese-related sulfurtransferase
MLKKIFLGMVFFVTLAFSQNSFNTLSTKQVQEEIKKNVPIIDIRREEEWDAYGVIKGSHKLTFFDRYGKYDIQKWMTQFVKIVPTKDTKFILVCAHANRTKVVANFLSKELGYTNVNELDGGINYGWIDKGLKTVK